jgi:serine/threonine protein kinase
MMQVKQIDGYKVYINQLLGKGSFAMVYPGASDKTGRPVAVKVMSKS